MKKRLFVLLLLLTVNKLAHSQIDTVLIKQQIKTQSNSMFAAFKQQDWESFSAFMHPTIMTLSGGKDKFIALLTTEMESLSSVKFTELVQVGNIQLIATKKSMQCVVQYGLNMLLDSTTVSGVSTSIGESIDKGVTWKFVRNNSTTFTQIKTYFPWVDNRLNIPREEQKFGITLQDFLKTYKPVYITKPKNTFAIRTTNTRKKKK